MDYSSIIWLGKSGKYALVDNEDHEQLVSGKKWQLQSSGNLYAVRRCVRMHRLIMRLAKGEYEVDHINGNGLDNRKENLRIATSMQNSQNARLTRRNACGFKGVYFARNKNYTKPYRATIYVSYKKINLGAYRTAIEAAMAYDEAAIKYFGEFAFTNYRMGLITPTTGESK